MNVSAGLVIATTALLACGSSGSEPATALVSQASVEPAAMASALPTVLPAALPSVLPSVLPSTEIASCLASVGHAPELETIALFREADRRLTATWELADESEDVSEVRLRLEADGLAQTVSLGRHVGIAYAYELSSCRRADRGKGPCSRLPLRGAPPRGVLAELSVEEWYAYMPQRATRWLLVRTPTSILVLRADGHLPRFDDRGLCTPGFWQRVLDIPVGPHIELLESVEIGGKAMDCTRSYQGDARCTG